MSRISWRGCETGSMKFLIGIIDRDREINVRGVRWRSGRAGESSRCSCQGNWTHPNGLDHYASVSHYLSLSAIRECQRSHRFFCSFVAIYFHFYLTQCGGLCGRLKGFRAPVSITTASVYKCRTKIPCLTFTLFSSFTLLLYEAMLYRPDLFSLRQNGFSSH